MGSPTGRRGIKSKIITTSGIVTAVDAAGLLWGVALYTAAADSKIEIKDGATGGTVLLTVAQDASIEGNVSTKHVMFTKPVVGVTDLFATIAGVGATAEVFYEELE